MSNQNEAKIPVMLNRLNLASEVGVSKSAVFRAYEAGKIEPDARMVDGQPLFFAHRVTEITRLLNSPKIV